MLEQTESFDPNDVIELSFFVKNSDDGVVITFPNKGSISPLDFENYIKTVDNGYKILDNEITVQEYRDVLTDALKALKRSRSKSVKFAFHNLVKYGVILGIPDYGYTNIGDIRSFIF